MDGARFDDLARILATSRRSLLKTVLGGAVAGMGTLVAREAVAAKKPRPPGYERVGKPCDAGEPCGDKLRCQNGSCTPLHCWIGNAEVQPGTPNPDNTCQYCEPANIPSTWFGWRTHPDETVCGDPTGLPCISDFSTCLAGECVPLPLPDGHECGPGQVCCRGKCCEGGVICNPVTGCGGCAIGDRNYRANATNPNHDCQVCDASRDPYAWSLKRDESWCGNGDRICCGGTCCGNSQCCSEVGQCTDACG